MIELASTARLDMVGKPMRFSAHSAANAAAWVVLVAIFCVAVVLTRLLGFAGLFLLGGMTWLVCLRAEMDHDAPTWGAEVFKAQLERQQYSPEQRASMLEERRVFVSPLRFYRWCGIFLAAVGLIGFVWQNWFKAVS